MANVTDNSGIRGSQPSAVPLGGLEALSLAQGPTGLLDDVFIPQIIKICEEVFPGGVIVESVVDPSDPGDPWLSFGVTAKGEIAAILKCELEWHERIVQLTGDRSGKYRVSINPIE
jgi:hypothetical protein